MKKIGNFKIESGKVRISDPCYDRDIPESCVFSNVKVGKWVSYIKQDGKNRVGSLIALHNEIEDNTDFAWVSDEDIGVDSGQAGIFDDQYYKDSNSIPSNYKPKNPEYFEHLVTRNNTDRFYSACCDCTLSDAMAGVIKYGVVSSTGYGDGMYSTSIVRNNSGDIVGIKITFINEEMDYMYGNEECDESEI